MHTPTPYPRQPTEALAGIDPREFRLMQQHKFLNLLVFQFLIDLDSVDREAVKQLDIEALLLLNRWAELALAAANGEEVDADEVETLAQSLEQLRSGSMIKGQTHAFVTPWGTPLPHTRACSLATIMPRTIRKKVKLRCKKLAKKMRLAHQSKERIAEAQHRFRLLSWAWV